VSESAISSFSTLSGLTQARVRTHRMILNRLLHAEGPVREPMTRAARALGMAVPLWAKTGHVGG
jgi:hypothetical protein